MPLLDVMLSVAVILAAASVCGALVTSAATGPLLSAVGHSEASS
jgi:hypothetical protein